MKSNTNAFLPFALFALAVLTVVIPGRAADKKKNDLAKFEVRIPFAFTVGNRPMPPGVYRFEQLLGSDSGIDILVVRCPETDAYQAVTTKVVTSRQKDGASHLVFHRYGDHTFLSGLWIRGKRVGLQLHQSVAEKEIAQTQIAAAEEFSLMLNNQATVASVADNSY